MAKYNGFFCCFFFQFVRQLQELESKFKEAYSQSLSNKDERIQVLEKRIDETTADNNQLREELTSTKKQYEKLRELIQASSGESPHGSPSMKRMNSPRELSRLKEQAADAMKLRDKLHRVQEDVSQSCCLSLTLSLSLSLLYSLSSSSFSLCLPSHPLSLTVSLSFSYTNT